MANTIIPRDQLDRYSNKQLKTLLTAVETQMVQAMNHRGVPGNKSVARLKRDRRFLRSELLDRGAL